MRTTLKQTLAGAWMLLAALALSTAGCSQLEDTPDAPSVATGNEPISISIAPKPGFEAGDAQTRSIIQAEAQTRSTVDGSGNFEWEGGDDMRTIFTFDDAAATVQAYKWTKNGTITTPVAGWKIVFAWQGGSEVTTMNWPVGAKTCKVQAFYTNCRANTDGYGYSSMEYGNGMGDHMIFEKTFSVGEELKIDFAHSTTRVTFKGLKPLTTYTLKLNDDADQLLMPASFLKSTFNYGTDYAPQPFTTDDNGTFTRCLPLTSAIDATSGEVKINVFSDDGTAPITEGTLKAKGSAPAWKTDGLQYIMTAKDFAGDMNPDNHPDLIPPPPVQPGAPVHVLNGYYITKAHPTGSFSWEWIIIESNNPCKKAGNGWRIPTMKDFEAIMGWGTSNPWLGAYNVNQMPLGAGITAAEFNAIFPADADRIYWASENKSDQTTHSWGLNAMTGTARYSFSSKGTQAHLRCVQKQ